MPERKTTFRVDCTPVQGKDSWAELTYMSWGEVQAAMSGALESDEALKEHLKDWNWVDDAGEPLELSVDVLFWPERTFLLDALFVPVSVAEAKN